MFLCYFIVGDADTHVIYIVIGVDYIFFRRLFTMSKSELSNLFSCTCNWKTSTLEYLIKKEKTSVSTSRNEMLPRYVNEAMKVNNNDWVRIYDLWCNLKPEKEASSFTNYQAYCGEDTAKNLEKIRTKVLKSLKDSRNINAVRTQFLLQIIMMNYYDNLLRNKLVVKDDSGESEHIDLPQMAAIFTKMALTDKDCSELNEIRKILEAWERK